MTLSTMTLITSALTSYLAERLTRICATLPKTAVGNIDKVALKATHRG